MGKRKKDKKPSSQVPEPAAEAPAPPFQPLSPFQKARYDLTMQGIVQMFLLSQPDHSITWTADELIAADEGNEDRFLESTIGPEGLTVRLVAEPPSPITDQPVEGVVYIQS